MMLAIIACLMLLLVPISASVDVKASELKLDGDVSKREEFLTRGFDWIGDRFLGVIETFMPDGRNGRASSVEGRKHKKVKLNKYVFPMLVGFLLIKSVLLPLALKALAILSGKAVVLSLMSLILASIVGLRSVANSSNYSAQSKVDHLPLSKYRRKDVLDHADPIEEEPYRYYGERRRRRKRK